MVDHTRLEPYEQVWSKHTVHLAKDLGLSDVAVARAPAFSDEPARPAKL